MINIELFSVCDTILSENIRYFAHKYVLLTGMSISIYYNICIMKMDVKVCQV